MPADARALLRADARALRDELAAARRRGLHSSKETQAHIAESLSTLDEALKAPLHAARRLKRAAQWTGAAREAR